MLGPANFPIFIQRGIAYGPIPIICYDDIPPPDGTGNVVPLTGYTVFAQARRKTDDREILFDLGPVITDAGGGAISIPKLTDEQTLRLKPVSDGVWNLVLQNAAGDRLPPIVSGSYNVSTSVTRREP